MVGKKKMLLRGGSHNSSLRVSIMPYPDHLNLSSFLFWDWPQCGALYLQYTPHLNLWPQSCCIGNYSKVKMYQGQHVCTSNTFEVRQRLSMRLSSCLPCHALWQRAALPSLSVTRSSTNSNSALKVDYRSLCCLVHAHALALACTVYRTIHTRPWKSDGSCNGKATKVRDSGGPLEIAYSELLYVCFRSLSVRYSLRIRGCVCVPSLPTPALYAFQIALNRFYIIWNAQMVVVCVYDTCCQRAQHAWGQEKRKVTYILGRVIYCHLGWHKKSGAKSQGHPKPL